MLILYSRERKLSWSIHRLQIEDQELITNSYAGSIGGNRRPKCHSFELKIPFTHILVLSVSNFYPDFTKIYVRCLRHRVCVIHIIWHNSYRTVKKWLKLERRSRIQKVSMKTIRRPFKVTRSYDYVSGWMTHSTYAISLSFQPNSTCSLK